MNSKKIMLVAVVLLAILTLGAVSASDTGDNLTAIDDGGNDLSIAETPLGDGDAIFSDDENVISLDSISNGTEVDDDFDENGTEFDDDFEFDDENDGVQIYVKKDTYFSQDSDDRLISVLVPNDQTGGVQVVGQRDDEYHRFFYKEFSEFNESKVYPYGDYNKVYWISPLDLGGFDGIQGSDVYVQAFDNSENIVTNLYYISWLDGSFKLNPSNSNEEGEDEEGPNFEFSEDEIITDEDNENYDINARVVSGYFSEPTSGILILSNENVTLLNKTISDDDGGWEREHGDSIYRILLKDISSFEGVNDGDVFELAFYMDGEDEPAHTSSIAIEVGEGYVKFVEWFDPNEFRVADAHDDVSVLETWDVIALYCPDGHVGIVNVTVRNEDGDEYSFYKDIEDKDEENLLHWNLTDLGMENIGFYDIEVNVNDGEFKQEWTTEVYIPIRYEEEIYLYPCDMVAVEVPTEYEDGIIIVEVDGSQLFNRTLSEFSSEYDDFYWTYDRVGNGEDDFNSDIKVYHIQNSIIPDIELRTYEVNTILIVNGRTMDKSAEIEITEGDLDHNISVNIWDNEKGDLYVDTEYDVVSVDVPGDVEGTITVIVNGDNKFVWAIDNDYHGWTLMDLEIVEAGDYNIVVKHDDEIICNETISVVEFNNNKVRVVVVSDKLRIFCPENVTGTVTISIEGQDVEGLFYPIGNNFTYGLTQNRWTEWSADDLNLELDTYYRITLIVSNNADEVLYNATEWYEFERFEENCKIWYEGSEDIVARGNWASVNRFKFYHEMGVEGIVSFYLENDWDSEPAYTLDLSDKPTGYYYVSLANLGIFEPGKYEIGINYEHDGDVEGYDCVVTVYEPQTVTAQSGKDIGGDFYLTIDILPVRTVITGNTYNDYVIFLDGYVDSYMGQGSLISVLINGERRVVYNTNDLICIPMEGWIIGSHELGIDKEGFYDISVYYEALNDVYSFSCSGTIHYISNVSMDVSMYNFHSDILYYGYGMDTDYYITIWPRDNHFPLDDLEGTVTVYIDGNPNVFDIRSLEIVGDDENGNYFISASQLNITEGNHSITVIYEGNCPGVEITQNFTAVKLTSEKFFEYSDIEINENISNESDSAISIDFWGNPMSAEPMIWGKLVLYVNGEKINRTQVVIYEESERWINWTTYDINNPEAIELINKIHQNQLPGWEYDIYDWLCLVHIYWHFNETLDMSLEDLNITSPGEYNITFKYIGESGEGPQLELLRGTIHYNLKNNLTLAVNADDIDYGSPANIVITTDETFSGTIAVSIEGVNYGISITNGKGSMSIPNLSVGSYTVVASYTGDDYFNQVQGEASFTVKKAPAPAIVIDSLDSVVEGSDLAVNVSISGATGVVIINGREFTLADGVASTTISNVDVGDLVIDVIYNGDDRYLNASNSKTVTVYAKLNPYLSVSADDIDFGGIVTVNVVLNETITADVLVKVGGDNYAVNVVNGKGSLNISDLGAGNYDVKALFAGNGWFLAAENTTSFIVNKVDSILILAEGGMYDLGSFGYVTFTYEGATGVLASVVNHTEAIVNIGYYNTISISNLTPGKYNVTVATVPDANHNEVVETIEITVTSKKATIQIMKDLIFDYGGSDSTRVVITGAKEISVIVVNHTEAVVDINSSLDIASNANVSLVTVSNLSAGTYTLFITTVGNEPDDSANATAAITVNKVNSTLGLANINFDYGSSGSTNAAYTGATGITAVVVDHPEAVIKINGNKITLSGLNAGTYTLRVATIGDENHTSTVKTSTVKVNKLTPVLSASQVTTTYGTSKKLVVTLKHSNIKYFVGKQISIKLNGKTYNAKILSNGRATFTVPATLAVKKYTAAVTFKGDENSNKKTYSVNVVVKKATPKVTAGKKSYAVSLKTKVYNVVVKSDKNKAIAKGKVTLRVNGRTYTTTTTSSGIAVFKITNLNKKGTFKANVKFYGNANFNAKAVNTNIIVK